MKNRTGCQINSARVVMHVKRSLQSFEGDTIVGCVDRFSAVGVVPLSLRLLKTQEKQQGKMDK